MSDKSTSAGSIAEPKGKGKAQEPPHDVSMDEDDSSDEETGAEEEPPEEPEDEDPDNMEEIDMSNIINSGRRTRGKTIDFAKAAEAAGDDLDDDEDDDDDFEAPLDDDAMQD